VGRLRLVLNAEGYEYTDLASHGTGLRMVFHSHDERHPQPEIVRGVMLSVGVHAHIDFRLPAVSSPQSRLMTRLHLGAQLWSKKWGYRFRRRTGRPWVPRREGRKMGRKCSLLIWLLDLGERHVLSQLGRKWFYCNLFSADRFCWQQVTANSLPSCHEKWGVLYPSVQKNWKYRYANVYTRIKVASLSSVSCWIQSDRSRPRHK